MQETLNRKQMLERAMAETTPLPVPCPACKKEQARVIRVGISEDPDWPVYACLNCRLRFIEPRFPDLRDYYVNEYRKGHTETKGHGSPDQSETTEERFRVSYLAAKESAHIFMHGDKQHEAVPEGASVLEIGPSAGGFLSHLEGKYDLFACEWNPEDAAFVRDVGKVPCEEGDLMDVFPGRKFTAIVARQVLEHQADPVAFLWQCRERLIGGGWLFLELPNANNALAAVYQVEEYRNWWYTEPHITYWEPETLANLLSATGFEARVMPFQRFGLLHTFVWLAKRQGVAKEEAIKMMSPVASRHPLAPALNRIWGQFDRAYRIQMETLGCPDYLRAFCRRREI